MSSLMIERTITLYAKEIGKPLAPGWNAELHEIDLGADANALDTLVATLGWEPAKVIAERPRADQLPLHVSGTVRNVLRSSTDLKLSNTIRHNDFSAYECPTRWQRKMKGLCPYSGGRSVDGNNP